MNSVPWNIIQLYKGMRKLSMNWQRTLKDPLLGRDSKVQNGVLKRAFVLKKKKILRKWKCLPWLQSVGNNQTKSKDWPARWNLQKMSKSWRGRIKDQETVLDERTDYVVMTTRWITSGLTGVIPGQILDLKSGNNSEGYRWNCTNCIIVWDNSIAS